MTGEDVERHVMLIAGLPIAHHAVGATMAEAHTMVSLVYPARQAQQTTPTNDLASR